MAKAKIALLYERLSRDDDKSKVHKHQILAGLCPTDKVIQGSRKSFMGAMVQRKPQW